MPDDDLGQPLSVAGNFPASPTTLRNLQTLAVDPAVSKTALINTIERDPALLSGILLMRDDPGGPLRLWHNDIAVEVLRAGALQLALSVPVDNGNVAGEAICRARIASEIAATSSVVDPDDARLTALLSALERSAESGSNDNAINTTSELAVSLESATVDPRTLAAIRYQSALPATMAGADSLLVINALARVCASGDALDGAWYLLASTQLGIDGSTLDTLRQEAPAIGDAPDTDASGETSSELVQGLISGAIYQAILSSAGESHSVQNAIVQQLARLVFGSRHVTLIEAGNHALATAGGSVARSLADGAPVVAGREALSLVVEQQWLDAAGSTTLVSIPLRDDALVAATTAPRAIFLNDCPAILHTFQSATADASRLSHDASDATAMHAYNRRIAHEINNPLAIMRNYVRTLGMKLGDAHDATAELDALAKEIDRVSTMVQQLNDRTFAAPAVDGEVDVVAVVNSITSLMQASAPDVNFRVEVAEAPGAVFLPEDALRQVLINLLKNAIEAVQDISPAEVSVRVLGNVNLAGRPSFEIEVADDGTGMNGDQRLSLFQGGSSKGEGRGLGLGIVRDLVAGMSGLISCRAAQPRGTIFQLILPVDSRLVAPNEDMTAR